MEKRLLEQRVKKTMTDQADEEDGCSGEPDNETANKLGKTTRCVELLVAQRPTTRRTLRKLKTK